MNFSIDVAAENIPDNRTREYFGEVLSSFVNENYRSAIVMLWSVVVSDLVYKLQTLRDVYQDPVATAILADIDARQQANPTNPDWELYLLEQVKERTHLLEVGDYQHLVTLQKLRHLSAHPVLSSLNLLFAPNRETARATIRNALEAVLMKPAIFSKRIVVTFVEDIAAKKALLPDETSLRQYLEAKYFRNLHPAVERELIKALWKFCFRISNTDTDANRSINARVLYLLYRRDPVGFRLFIEQNSDTFSEIAANGTPLEALVDFLAMCPALYSALTDAAKAPLAAFVRTSADIFARAIFISDSFMIHLGLLKDFDYSQLREIGETTWASIVSLGREQQAEQSVFEVGIKVYCNSQSFDGADINFVRFVEPIVEELDSDRVRLLLDGIEINNQTYWRGRARVDHPSIQARALQLGNIDINNYPNFCSSLPGAE